MAKIATFPGKKDCGHDEVDICYCVIDTRKPLDVNKYATKKTIAQGMLDIALLTANASQLKYILQVGQKHEFYSLMLGLITTSLILQVLVGILLLSLNFLRDCRLHLLEYKTSAIYINYITTAFSVAITAINLLISAFDPSLAQFASSIDFNDEELLPRLGHLKTDERLWRNVTTTNGTKCDRRDLVSNNRRSRREKIARTEDLPYPERRYPPADIPNQFRQCRHIIVRNRVLEQSIEVSVAVLNLILSQLNFMKEEHEILSSVLNHIATGCAMFAMVSDVIKMSFGLDPALSLQDFYRDLNSTKK